MEAHTQSVSKIFSGDMFFIIPYYQRAYVWDIEQWERFLEDMENVSKYKKSYFIGSMILKQKLTSSAETVGNQRIIIDGQQRLTTITVFFKVLSLLKENPGIFEKFKVQLDDDGNEWATSIRHNHIDSPYFNKIVDLETPRDLLTFKKGCFYDEDGKYIKNPNQVLKLYQYLLDNLRDRIADFSPMTIQSKVQFVVIDIGIEEDEQQIFDTINSLGVTLTTSELLKNYLFDENNVEEFNQLWLPMFEKDKEEKDYWDTEVVSGILKPHLIDLFFNAFLLVKIHEDKYDVNTEEKKEYMRSDQLFSSYKDFVKKHLGGDKSELIPEIFAAASSFRQFFIPDIKYRSISADNCRERINAIIFALDGTTLIPYVLYLLLNAEKEEKDKIFDYLESYIMRRVICHSDTRGYNKLFGDSLLTNHILTLDALVEYINEKGERLISFPDNEAVKDGIYNRILINKQNTGILYMLESRLRTDKTFATRLQGLNNYSLEHLMPKKWKETWDKTGLTEEVIRLRDDKLWTLGNLAIIPSRLNSSISNAPWLTKLSGKGPNKQGLKECASGLITLNSYLDYTEWTEKSIDTRAEDLWNKIIEVWVDYSYN